MHALHTGYTVPHAGYTVSVQSMFALGMLEKHHQFVLFIRKQFHVEGLNNNLETLIIDTYVHLYTFKNNDLKMMRTGHENVSN